MGSNRPRAFRAVVVEAAISAFWTSLLAGVATAVFGFPTFFILGERPPAGEDGYFIFFAVYPGCALLAVTSGVVWGVVSAIWRPPRMRRWLIAGAVGIGLSLLLAVVTLISGSPAAGDLAMLCWFASSFVVVPTASAACVHPWLQRRGKRAVRHTLVAAASLVVVVLAAFVGAALRFPWLRPWR